MFCPVRGVCNVLRNYYLTNHWARYEACFKALRVAEKDVAVLKKLREGFLNEKTKRGKIIKPLSGKKTTNEALAVRRR